MKKGFAVNGKSWMTEFQLITRGGGRSAGCLNRPSVTSLMRQGLRIGLAWFLRASARRIKAKRLAVSETVALGDRRFVAVIEFEGQRFLIGSSPSAVTLLSRLRPQGAREHGSGDSL